MRSKPNRSLSPAVAPLHLGGKLYLVSSPTEADYLTARREFRRLASAAVRNPLAAIADDLLKLPAHLQQIAIDAAVKQQAGAEKAEPTDAAIAEQLYTEAGCRFFVWLLTRRQHPEAATPEHFDTLITNANVTDVLAALFLALNLDEGEENSPGKAGGLAGSPSPTSSTASESPGA